MNLNVQGGRFWNSVVATFATWGIANYISFGFIPCNHRFSSLMLRRVLKLTTSPRTLLRSVLALDDSPHAVALGVAIGIFVGLTPSVGVQTIMILVIVFCTRPFFYFNGTAAMASTYVSNPITMAPMYYFWYHLGAWLLPGTDCDVNFDALLNFEGLAGWWESTSALAVQVGGPMLLGALLTAPVGAGIAYPLTRYFVNLFRESSQQHSPPPPGGSGTGDVSGPEIADSNSTAAGNTSSDSSSAQVSIVSL